MQFVKGNLLTSPEYAIAHGCNTKGSMSAGIAGQIASMYPEAAAVYKRAVTTSKFLPGTCLPVHISEQTRGSRLIMNLATQDLPGAHASYWWVHLSFANMGEYCVAHNIHKVAIPRIGCGIGGLRWGGVETAINQSLEDLRVNRHYDFEIVVYDFEPASFRG